MKIKFKKLHSDAVIPVYQTKGASGFDFHALEDVSLATNETKLIKTGLSVAIPEGFELQVRPRSGLSLKTYLRVANSPGTVDSDFRGEICVIITNTDAPTNDVFGGYSAVQHAYHVYHIKKGDRIAQGVICPIVQAEIEVVDTLDETERGTNGFGSSGT